jgi:hypothetical protein
MKKVGFILLAIIVFANFFNPDEEKFQEYLSDKDIEVPENCNLTTQMEDGYIFSIHSYSVVCTNDVKIAGMGDSVAVGVSTESGRYVGAYRMFFKM